MKRNLYKPILINTALIICFTFSLYGLVVDLPLIDKYRQLYVLGRVVSALVCLFFIFQVNVLKKQYESQIPLIYMTIVLYCIHGHYFVNGYYLAFMQAVAGFSLFFAMAKKYYFPVTVLGGLMMLVSIWTSLYSYSDAPEKALKFNIDSSLGIVLISVICSIGYLNITLVREQKQRLAEKFLDVGRLFGDFIHELKGMATSPTVYVDLLSSELRKESPDLNRLREITGNLKIDIENMNERILNFNSLSKNTNELAPIDIRALVGAIEKHFFLNDRLKIEVITKTNKIYGNEFSVRSILLNLITNSKENFLLKGLNDKSIQITVETQKIVFMDNGGGFSKEALGKIKNNSYFSEKASGSGIGLFLVNEYMKEFNGKAFFRNRTDNIPGVHIELHFSRRDHI